MASEKKPAGATEGLPEVEILMKGLLAQPGVDGFMVYNESGAFGMAHTSTPTQPNPNMQASH